MCVVVWHVQEILVKLVGWCFEWIQPKCTAACALSKFSSLLVSQQGNGAAENLTLTIRFASNEISSRCDVSPLIAASNLDRALVILEQLVEVVSLKDLVAKFSERNTLLRGQTRFYTVSSLHARNSEMLSNVAQEM